MYYKSTYKAESKLAQQQYAFNWVDIRYIHIIPKDQSLN